MQIGVIGGTGFVGQAIVARLLADGHHVRLLVRPGSERKVSDHAACTAIRGTVEDADALKTCLSGCDAVIYLIGILREFPARGITFEALQQRGVERTIAAAQANGIKRFLLMSANGVGVNKTPYQRTKLLAEHALRQSGLDWTIFRPSVIFGDPQGRMEFCTQLKKELIDSPLPAPLFYRGLFPQRAGQFQLAPVWVEDVAAAFALAVTEPETIGQTYELCGPNPLTWQEILVTIAAAVGKTKLMLPAPALFLKPVAALFERFAWFPITRDQLEMLLDSNVCTEDGFARLGIVPRRFDRQALAYLTAS